MKHSVTAYLERQPTHTLLEVRQMCLEDEGYAYLLPIVERILEEREE